MLFLWRTPDFIGPCVLAYGYIQYASVDWVKRLLGAGDIPIEVRGKERITLSMGVLVVERDLMVVYVTYDVLHGSNLC